MQCNYPLFKGSFGQVQMTFQWHLMGGLISVLVLMDFSAAFGTNDHRILIQRLDHLTCIKGITLCWFKSYLWDRFQFANIELNSMHTKVNQ